MVDLRDLTTSGSNPEKSGEEGDSNDTPKPDSSVNEALSAIRDRLEADARDDEDDAGREPAAQPSEIGPLGLEFEPVMPPRPRGRTGFRMFMAFVGLIVFGAAGAWYLLGDRLEEAGGGDVPVVKADPGPVKVKPESPGGMEVPNRDKLVYNRIRSGDVEPKVERLLPPPEEPVEKSAMAGSEAPEEAAPPPPAAPSAAEPMPRSPRRTAEAETVKPVPSTQDVQAATKPAQPAIAEALKERAPSPESKVGMAPTPQPEPVAPVAEAPKPQPAPAPKAEAAPQVAAAPPAPMPADMAKAYKIQMAAVRTQTGAEKEWARLKKAHADLLSGLELDVQRADLGAKGVFYRLRAGPLADENQARGLCTDLKKRKVGCLVVAPGK